MRLTRVSLSGCGRHLSSWRPCLWCSESTLEAHWIDGRCARPRRNTIVGAGAIDREAVSKGSNRSCGLRVEADVALLRPRLLPLSGEQEAEAGALLCEL